MAAKKQETADDENKRRYCTLSPATVRFLEKLAARGTHGTSVPKVMTQMIEAGVRDAIERGYIDLKDGD